MNERTIQTVLELEEEIRNLLVTFELPQFSVRSRQQREESDFLVDVELDGKRSCFAVECKLKPTAGDIVKLAASNSGPPPLLATVVLSDSQVRLCKDHNVNCIDLNGRLWLRGKGLLVNLLEKGVRPRFRLAERPANFFSSKSSRLARILLSFRERKWTQKQLADLTGLSQGLLSRLLNHAVAQGWVDGSRGNWTVIDHNALLDAWEQADDWKKRGVVRQYSGLSSSLTSIAHHLLEATVGDIAYTQWFAAHLRFPYTEPTVVSAYRSEFLNEEDKQRLKMREVEDGGKLWIIVPTDNGPFQANQQVEGLPLVCDAQIYLDLLNVGLRGPEQARALRQWAGFSR